MLIVSDIESNTARDTMSGVLVNEFQLKGYKSFKWNGKDNNGKKLGSGVYFYQLQIDNYIKTKKMIMLK